MYGGHSRYTADGMDMDVVQIEMRICIFESLLTRASRMIV